MPIHEKRIENLRKANEESHRMIVDSLREALYKLLETKDVSDIKVVDLIREAGISRGVFYKHFYLITDVLADDIREIVEDIRKASGADIGRNWEIILRTVYAHKKKLPLLLKAGMGMEILNQINHSMDTVPDASRLRILAWNGIVFNSILYWSANGFRDSVEDLTAELTKLTMPLYLA